MQNYIGKSFSSLLCRYRKGVSTQYLFLSVIEKWRLCLEKEYFAGALLMNLSKAFDAINYELLTAELHKNWFSIEALEFLLTYYKKSGEESKSIQLLVLRFNNFKGFHKNWFLILCWLTFTSMIYFLQ